jgi:hypothetical protein
VKRLLDIVSAVLVVLAVALGWRLVHVVQVEPPVFGDAPQTAKIEPLPPPPSSPTPRGAGMDAIVDGNLFETERGFRELEAGEDDATVEEPLPPPTNVVLNGVFFAMTGRPMAIMTDTNSGNRQLTLQKGDNLGDYQVGDITNQRVTLLGRGGQEFALELDIRKGGGGAPASSRAPVGRGSAATARPPARPPARPAQPAVGDRATATRSPAAERVTQTAAQRAAEARRQQAARARQQAAASNRRPQAQQEQKPDPTEQRLEALRRLREAARAR